MNPRLPMLDLDAARKAAAAAGVNEGLAELNIFRVLLHEPRFARSLADLLLGLLFGGRLDVRLRELAILRLGWATASDYEWTQHWRIALGLQVPEADALGVRAWEQYAGFGAAERAVLAATDETLATGAVSAATWEACRHHVSDDPAVLVELLGVIGTWRMVSAVLKSLEIPLEDGVASWPPDGEAPRQ